MFNALQNLKLPKLRDKHNHINMLFAINFHIELKFLPPLDTICLSVYSRNLREFLYSVSAVHAKNVLPSWYELALIGL